MDCKVENQNDNNIYIRISGGPISLPPKSSQGLSDED